MVHKGKNDTPSVTLTINVRRVFLWNLYDILSALSVAARLIQSFLVSLTGSLVSGLANLFSGKMKRIKSLPASILQ